ncbi:hypothetical protein GGR51DRAFT_411977 [Nemania sp. FL0031]|nr:hypothetical protein GGR51DRAFT_411977 [Nemania sp. FL0031]
MPSGLCCLMLSVEVSPTQSLIVHTSVNGARYTMILNHAHRTLVASFHRPCMHPLDMLDEPGRPFFHPCLMEFMSALTNYRIYDVLVSPCSEEKLYGDTYCSDEPSRGGINADLLSSSVERVLRTPIVYNSHCTLHTTSNSVGQYR